jgi:hypothetical protein
MRAVWVAAFVGAGMAGPVSAQAVGVDPGATSSIETRSGFEQFDGSNISAYRASSQLDGGGFEASVTVTSESISFRNGAIALGAFGDIVSTTFLTMTVTNTGASPIPFTSFESLIIPAGMGMFIASPSAGCTALTPNGCGSFEGDADFQDLARPNDLPPGNELGTVGFDFRVLADGTELYALSASLGLEEQGGVNLFVPDLMAAEAALNGFTLATDPLSSSTIGYAWEATPFVLTLPDQTLDPGETRTITYISSVFARSFAAADGNSFLPLPLLAYSAFGDPVGRPGGGGSFAGSFVGQSFGEPIEEVEIGSFTFVYPYFRDGRLFLPLTAIPEPATWAMLVVGFGLLGTAARRRRAAGLSA